MLVSSSRLPAIHIDSLTTFLNGLRHCFHFKSFDTSGKGEEILRWYAARGLAPRARGEIENELLLAQGQFADLIEDLFFDRNLHWGLRLAVLGFAIRQ